MPPLRVWVNYEPKIYTDIFKQVFQSMCQVEIVEQTPADPGFNSNGDEHTGVDVVLLSLDGLDQSKPELNAEILGQAKVLAFSPRGDFGLRRMPGKANWEEVRPFGLKQLIDELTAA